MAFRSWPRPWLSTQFVNLHIDGYVQERRNSSAYVKKACSVYTCRLTLHLLFVSPCHMYILATASGNLQNRNRDDRMSPDSRSNYRESFTIIVVVMRDLARQKYTCLRQDGNIPLHIVIVPVVEIFWNLGSKIKLVPRLKNMSETSAVLKYFNSPIKRGSSILLPFP